VATRKARLCAGRSGSATARARSSPNPSQ
jgi:hypothetical protein